MKPIVRILIVTDDGLANGGFLRWAEQSMPAAVSSNSREFHLGEYLRVLNETAWLGFDIEITKAHRSKPGSGGMDEAALKADRGADIVGFHFDKPFEFNGETRTLANYDMILFFSTKVSNPDDAFKTEAEAIAKFMEDGGGFFATGDHANLGGEINGLIPRVRSMRRWYFSGPLNAESPPGPQGELPAPPPLGFYRHDTTRKGADGIGQFEDQSDEFPQEITPAFYDAGITVKSGYTATKYYPHPLLCSPEGAIRYLPDHMHEGTCEVPDNLSARTFKIGSSTIREYPDYIPDSPPPGFTAKPLAPEIVAWGKVLPGTMTPALDPEAHTGSSDVAMTTDFGVIAAWDGHRVKKGRVVVDSTWHHFFDINLTGDRYLEDESLPPQHQQKLHGFYIPNGMGGRKPCDEYNMIKWYFRNIIYWLIPANRMQSIWWSGIEAVIRKPQLREELGTMANLRDYKVLRLEHYLYLGQLAEDYLAKARGACANYTIHVVLYYPKIPWWEWIQDYVDIWNPVQNPVVKENIIQERILSAMGLAPRLEVAATVSLGAALVASTLLQKKDRDREREDNSEQLHNIFTEVLDHAFTQLSGQLRKGAEIHRRFEKLLSAKRKVTEAAY